MTTGPSTKTIISEAFARPAERAVDQSTVEETESEPYFRAQISVGRTHRRAHNTFAH